MINTQPKLCLIHRPLWVIAKNDRQENKIIYILIIQTSWLTGCPVYDPPSKIEDSRLKLINNSDNPIQYLCSCDTISGKSFQTWTATIGSGNLVFPDSSEIIPGQINWDSSLSADVLPMDEMTLYVYTVNIENLEDYIRQLWNTIAGQK